MVMANINLLLEQQVCIIQLNKVEKTNINK